MSAAPEERNAAWVVLETPLAPAALAAFCGELETLYRINPFLEIASWVSVAPDRFRAEVVNHSNGQRDVLEACVVPESERAFRIAFAAGAKDYTRLEFDAAGTGSRLTITDEYRRTDEGAPLSADRADRSLHAWGVAIKSFLERDRRWGWFPLYRFYMRRVWLPLSPSARRIMFLVLVVAVADIALVALGLAVYWLESQR